MFEHMAGKHADGGQAFFSSLQGELPIDRADVVQSSNRGLVSTISVVGPDTFTAICGNLPARGTLARRHSVMTGTHAMWLNVLC